METTLRLLINLFSLVVIGILRLSGNRRTTAKTAVEFRIYHAMLASTAAMLVLDGASWVFDGRPGAVARAAVVGVNALYYAVHTLPTVFFILYTDFQIFRDDTRLAKAARPLVVLAALVAVAAAASIFVNILFVVDAANRYSRGPFFPVFAVMEYGLVGYALAFVAFNVKKMSRRVFITLLAFPLPLLVAAYIQMYFFGLVLLWPVTTLFLIASSFNIENRRARTDYLTGTANRRSLDEELERRIAINRSGKILCGLLIDIDDFKKINDLHGHEAGDRALEDIAAILLSSVRVEDLVSRMGGDEFVVLVDFKEASAMEDLVHRIESAVENRNASKLRPYRLALSIGRAVHDPAKGGNGPDFLAILDTDMYARKRAKA